MFSHTIWGGEKDKWLIAFYGYGQSASVFNGLYENIKDTHNMIVVDNPMQDYKQDINPEDLDLYLSNLFDQKRITNFQTVSYSMGSRLNLYLPIFFQDRLKKIILIAPDGISTNFWNRVAVSTPWGRKLFHVFTRPGNLYLNTLLFFHKIGIVNKSLYAFSKWNMRDDKRRKNVYNAWMNMRFMRPILKDVNNYIIKNKIELVTYFGSDDPVIPMSVQQRCKKFFPNGRHIIVDGDHNILVPTFFKQLATEIQK